MRLTTRLQDEIMRMTGISRRQIHRYFMRIGSPAYVSQVVFDYLVAAHGEEIAKYLVVVVYSPQTEVEQLMSLYSFGELPEEGEDGTE